MRRPRAVVLVVATLLLVGCGPLRQLLPTESGRHARTEAQLRERAEREDGWLVLELPNIHEGGGTTTWWLHPCDPSTDTEREVVRTAHHGSDVAGLPGSHQVQDDVLTCREPGSDVVLADGRVLRLHVEVVELHRSYGLLADRVSVVVEDEAAATRATVEWSGQPVSGGCDGRTSWTATLESPRELALTAHGCVDTLAALPQAALDLVRFGSGSPDDGVGRLDDADLAAFSRALAAAGWEPEGIAPDDPDGSSVASYWLGPCGPGFGPAATASAGAGPDRRTRPELDWHAGTLTISERTCD